MSEHLQPKHENNEKQTGSHESQKQARERLNEVLEKGEAAKNEHKENLSAIRDKIEAQPVAVDQSHFGKGEAGGSSTYSSHKMPVHKMLRKEAYTRLVKSAQRQLKPAERTLSKVMHQPTVEKLSEVGEKTIARPSGLFFGSLLSFIFTSVFVFSAKTYGWEYNFGFPVFTFVGGFALGLTLEMLYRLLFPARRSAQAHTK
jgi:hypothetical protein